MNEGERAEVTLGYVVKKLVIPPTAILNLRIKAYTLKRGFPGKGGTKQTNVFILSGEHQNCF